MHQTSDNLAEPNLTAAIPPPLRQPSIETHLYFVSMINIQTFIGKSGFCFSILVECFEIWNYLHATLNAFLDLTTSWWCVLFDYRVAFITVVIVLRVTRIVSSCDLVKSKVVRILTVAKCVYTNTSICCAPNTLLMPQIIAAFYYNDDNNIILIYIIFI